ncbi:MAG TPA: isoprenylcysteine carboxylmethyltransferase family protein [Vicinamibacterales bacterium]|jgi:protein-S-isoprenylcysteine O-methyltransferase Ste14|nr:isoprenylcysteine carboxylmethyltransferase family protein [Vicinamibacterales bacterium]
MTPVPFFVALLFVRAGEAPASVQLLTSGVAVVAVGEAIRLWGVHHIGAISRTRADRLGPLIDDGPFAIVRNPLYLGNIAVWVGFALIARLVWMAPLLAIILGLEYHAIVKWEEDLLASRLGDAYRDYMTRVPRWIPRVGGSRRTRPTTGAAATLHHGGHGEHRGRNLQDSLSASSVSSVVKSFSWSDTWFSERGTLIAIAAGYGLLWIKARF